jgi:hypothetical protein
MFRVLSEQFKVLACKILCCLWQLLKSIPELRRSAVHLELPQSTLPFRRQRLIDQKVKLAF